MATVGEKPSHTWPDVCNSTRWKSLELVCDSLGLGGMLEMLPFFDAFLLGKLPVAGTGCMGLILGTLLCSKEPVPCSCKLAVLRAGHDTWQRLRVSGEQQRPSQSRYR